MVTETDKAYLAGIIDGEGYIGIGMNKGTDNRQPQYVLRISIAQSNQPFLVCLRDKWGGLGSICVNRSPRQAKVGYRWHISANQAASILEDILPYLVIKKPQAELALEFQVTRGKPWKRVSEDELVVREGFKQRISSLNQQENILDS